MSTNVVTENGGGNSMSCSTYANCPSCNASVCPSRTCGAINFITSDLALPNFPDSRDVKAECHLEQKDKSIVLLLGYAPFLFFKVWKT
jgi:hypothetical protein